MRNRSVVMVLIWSILTGFVIYPIYWFVSTKREMNDKFGAGIPTAWLIIVPLVQYYWLWKYSEGVERATRGQTTAVVVFLLTFFLGPAGMMVAQAGFNAVPEPAGAVGLPQARVA